MKPINQINVIPFIDIMLVLLAVVLTTATFVAQGEIPLNLPKASSAQKPTETREINITLDSEGRLFFDNENMTSELLSKRIKSLSKPTRFLLRIDERAPFKDFIFIIDVLKQSHHEDIAIATLQADS